MTGDSWDTSSLELTPMSDYDERAAKQRLSVKWLILKSHLHVNEIPHDLLDPFYFDIDGNFNLKPHLINLLCSGELYCQAAANLFYSWNLPFHNVPSVICSLARKGFYMEEDNGIAVTESVLKQTAPLRLNAHLLLIDAMMDAFLKQSITIESSVKAVKESGARFSPSTDLPESQDDSVFFWINKIAEVYISSNNTFLEIIENELNDNLDSYENKIATNSEDLSDGMYLCIILYFYFGKHIFKGHAPVISSNVPISIADSIHNIQLFLRTSGILFPDFPFNDVKTEDILYSPCAIKPIFMCLLAEVFSVLSSRGFLKRESYPKTCVNTLPELNLNAEENLGGLLTNSPNGERPQTLFFSSANIPPISKVTKQSFVQQAGLRSSNSLTTDSCLYTPKSPVTPGVAKRLSADPLSNLLPKKIDPSENDDLLVKFRTNSQEKKIRPRSAFETGPTAGSIYSTLSSSRDGQMFCNSSRTAISNLLENCDMDDEISLSKCHLANEKDGSNNLASKKTYRKKWKSSNEDVNFKLSKNNGTWSKSMSPVIISAAPMLHPGKFDEKPISSKSFNIGEKVITEQAARAANIPVIDGDNSEDALQVKFFLKQTPIGLPKTLNSDFKKRRSSPFTPKFGNPEYNEESKNLCRAKEDVKTEDDIKSGGVCGQVFLKNNQTETPPGNRLSALFGSCDNFTSVLRHSNAYQADETVEKKLDSPVTTSFVDISDKLAAAGRTKSNSDDPASSSALASPKSSLKSSRVNSNALENVEHKLQNPTTWGEIGQDEKNKATECDIETLKPNGPQIKSPLSTQLAAMRMRLEEKRRAIERDKLKLESKINKDRQRFGKTAFLKVIGANGVQSPRHDSILEERETPGTSPGQTPTHELGKNGFLKPEISSRADTCSDDLFLKTVKEEKTESLSNDKKVNHKEVSGQEVINDCDTDNKSSFYDSGNRARSVSAGSDPIRDTPSPTSSSIAAEHHIDQLTASVSELQAEIQRLSLQQEQLKSQQLQSQFSANPEFASQQTLFSPPRAELCNSNFLGYPLQAMPTQYPHCTPVLNLPDQMSQLSQHQLQSQPPMMPHYSSLSNIIQHPSQNQLSTHYGSAVSIHSGVSSAVLNTSLNPQHNAISEQSNSDRYKSSIDIANDVIKSSIDNSDFSKTCCNENNTILSSEVEYFNENNLNQGPENNENIDLNKSVCNERSPRNVAWMTPPSSAGKVRASLAVQTPTHTSSSTSVNEPSKTCDSNIDISATSTEQYKNQTPSYRVPQPGVMMLLDASGKPQEIIDLETPTIPEPDTHEVEMERKKQEMILRQLKRKEEQELKRQKREAEAAAKREETQKRFEEQERKREAERLKKELILKEYIDQKKEEKLGPVDKETFRSTGKGVKKKTATLPIPKVSSPLPKGTSPDRYSRGRSPSHQNSKPNSAPMVCSTIRDLESGYAPVDNFVDFSHVPLMRTESSGVRSGSSSRRMSRPLSTHGGSVSTLNDHSETQSITSDYSGPRLYVQPSQRTNKKIICNSISQCCLAGAVNHDLKMKVVAELENSDAKHFLILFRDSKCQYRGVFTFDPDSEAVEKICGSGPKVVSPPMVEKFFKYSSGGKKFSEIYAKNISVTIDAFTIHNHLWQTAKTRNVSKTRPVSMCS